MEILDPINRLDALMIVLGPYTVKECVDKELISTLGVEIYPDEPRPCTVETRDAELT